MISILFHNILSVQHTRKRLTSYLLQTISNYLNPFDKLLGVIANWYALQISSPMLYLFMLVRGSSLLFVCTSWLYMRLKGANTLTSSG